VSPWASASAGGGRVHWGPVLGRGNGGSGLSVAGLVPTKGLVARKGLAADRALVRQLLRRWRVRLHGPSGSAAGQHDETEGQVLLLGRGLRGLPRRWPLSPGPEQLVIAQSVGGHRIKLKVAFSNNAVSVRAVFIKRVREVSSSEERALSVWGTWFDKWRGCWEWGEIERFILVFIALRLDRVSKLGS